jgi:hypothetical protein
LRGGVAVRGGGAKPRRNLRRYRADQLLWGRVNWLGGLADDGRRRADRADRAWINGARLDLGRGAVIDFGGFRRGRRIEFGLVGGLAQRSEPEGRQRHDDGEERCAKQDRPATAGEERLGLFKAADGRLRPRPAGRGFGFLRRAFGQG